MVGVAKTEDGIALHLNLGLGFDALDPDFAFWLNTPFEGLGMRAHSSDKESGLKTWHDGVLCPLDQGWGSGVWCMGMERPSSWGSRTKNRLYGDTSACSFLPKRSNMLYTSAPQMLQRFD